MRALKLLAIVAVGFVVLVIGVFLVMIGLQPPQLDIALLILAAIWLIIGNIIIFKM